MDHFKKLADLGQPVAKRNYSTGVSSYEAPDRPTPPPPSKPKTDGIKLPFPVKINKQKAAKKGFELMVENSEVTKSDTTGRPEIRVMGSKPLNGSLFDFDPLCTTTTSSSSSSWSTSSSSSSRFNDLWTSNGTSVSGNNQGFSTTPLLEFGDKNTRKTQSTALIDLVGVDFGGNSQTKPVVPPHKALVKPLAPQPATRPAAPVLCGRPVLPNKPTSAVTTITTEKKGATTITKTVTKTITINPSPADSGRLPLNSSAPDFNKPQRPTVIRPPPKPNRPPTPSGSSNFRLDNASKSFLSGSNSTDQLASGGVERTKKPAPPRPKSGPPRPVKPPQPKLNGHASPDLPSRPGPGHPLYHYMQPQDDRPRGRVLFNFTPIQNDELPLREGEVVYLEKRVDENWLLGRIGTRSGLFPANHVDIIQPIGSPSSDHSSGYPVGASLPPDRPELGPRCRARFDFDGQSPEDLSFREGDVFKIVERVGDEWLRGQHRGQIGIFPAAFVEIIENLPENGHEQLAANSWGDWEDSGSESQEDKAARARAIYDFEGGPNELGFKAGEKISILGRVDDEWLYGELNGLKGRFPVKFVASSQVPSELPVFSGSTSPTTASTPPVAKRDTTPKSLISPASTTSDISSMASPTSDDLNTAGHDEPHCVALYDFPAQQNGDLAFSAGDVISLTSRLGDDWLIGMRDDGESGMFPASFVRIVVDLPGQGEEIFEPKTPDFGPPPEIPFLGEPPRMNLPSNSDIPQARAIYDYDGRTDEQLSFKEGDLIILLERIDENWMMGELEGEIGQVADRYLEIITPLSP